MNEYFFYSNLVNNLVEPSKDINLEDIKTYKDGHLTSNLFNLGKKIWADPIGKIEILNKTNPEGMDRN